MSQNFLTPIIGFFCILIPLSFVWLAVARTPRHSFACPTCGADVPPTAARCPNCGSPMPNQDQKL